MMAKILKIDAIADGDRNIIKFYLEGDKSAEHFGASCLMSVRKKCSSADIYVEKNALCLDTPDKDMADQIGALLKNTIESTTITP